MTTIEEQKKEVAAFRSFFQGRPNLPIIQAQKPFAKSIPVKGPVWVAQHDIRVADEDTLRDVLLDTIRSAATHPIVLPEAKEISTSAVHVEWVGQRRGAAKDATIPPELSAADIFTKLQADAEHDLIILFAHGGAFYTGSSAMSRSVTTKLARLSKARIVSVDYRLAPRTQFPGQLLDLLLVYLALLYPPPGSLHGPVASNNIVLAGESSGGGLCLSMIQFILHLQRSQNAPTPTVQFGGRKVSLPMPAGVALHSAEADRSLGLASFKHNVNTDILPEIQPANSPAQPADSVWPSDPPRHDVYCHASAYLHPIANSCTAATWHGSPPLWLSYGEERCLDGGRLVASLALAHGVPVAFSEYTGMPHIFGIILARFKQSQACMAEWAAVARAMVDRKGPHTHAKVISSDITPGDTITDIDIRTILPYTRDEAMDMIKTATMVRKLYTGQGKATASL